MRLSIHRDSGTVTINGTSHVIDMTTVQPEIASVEWRDDHGEITYRDGKTMGMGDPLRFKTVIDAWHVMHNAMRMR